MLQVDCCLLLQSHKNFQIGYIMQDIYATYHMYPVFTYTCCVAHELQFILHGVCIIQFMHIYLEVTLCHTGIDPLLRHASIKLISHSTMTYRGNSTKNPFCGSVSCKVEHQEWVGPPHFKTCGPREIEALVQWGIRRIGERFPSRERAALWLTWINSLMFLNSMYVLAQK